MRKQPEIKGYLRGAAVMLSLVLAATMVEAAKLRFETVNAWEDYVRLTENRIASELDSGEGFLVQDFLPDRQARECQGKVLAGEVCVIKMEMRDRTGEKLRIPSGMVLHWMGSVFIPNVELNELLSWVKNYPDHGRYFEEVEDSELLAQDGDAYEILLRLKRKKLVTVHYNTEHRVEYRYHDPARVSSKSATKRIAQLENPGTSKEREKPEGNDSGFLWRLNSYWRYKEVNGGVLVELESISLSRGIPAAVKWLVGRYVNSVPRESIESTLESIRKGVAPRATARKGIPSAGSVTR